LLLKFQTNLRRLTTDEKSPSVGIGSRPIDRRKWQALGAHALCPSMPDLKAMGQSMSP